MQHRPRAGHAEHIRHRLGQCPLSYDIILLPVSLSMSDGELLAAEKATEQGANARTHKGSSCRLGDVILPGLRIACCYAISLDISDLRWLGRRAFVSLSLCDLAGAGFGCLHPV